MARRRPKEPNSSKRAARQEMQVVDASAARDLSGWRRKTMLRQLLFARQWVVWLLIGSVAAFILITGGWLRSRPQFDMVKALADLVAQEGPWDNPWDLQDKKIASLEADIKAEANPIKRLILGRELAQQYVGEGVAGGGIAVLEQLLSEYSASIPAADIETLKADLAYAYFRLGELTNCTWNHNADVCIFPIQGEGIHKQQLGATEAAQRYAALLADPATNPENALLYRWILNICHMVLGTYPDGVPGKWLIPPETFASDYDVGKFRDVAAGDRKSIRLNSSHVSLSRMPSSA